MSARARDVSLRDAARALRDLARDSADLDAGTRLFYGLGGRWFQRRLLARIRADPRGRALLGARPNVAVIVGDWDRLRRLPEGSLGRTYVDWSEARDISPAGLEANVESAQVEVDGLDMAYVRDRTRDLHDLWHLLAGYDIDTTGEIAVQAFTGAQHRNGACLVIALLGCVMAILRGRVDALPVIVGAWGRGVWAPVLLLEDWDSLLPRPVDEVRAELGLSDPPTYRRFFRA